MSLIGLNFVGSRVNGDKEEPGKNLIAEESCITGISLVCASMSFRKSPSNSIVSKSKCVFQFREVGEYLDEEVVENTYSLDWMAIINIWCWIQSKRIIPSWFYYNW